MVNLKYSLRFPLQSSQAFKGKGKPAGCTDARWIWLTEPVGKTAENLPSQCGAKNFRSFRRLEPLLHPSLDGLDSHNMGVVCKASTIMLSAPTCPNGHARALVLRPEDNPRSGAPGSAAGGSVSVLGCELVQGLGHNSGWPGQGSCLCPQQRTFLVKSGHGLDYFQFLFSPCFKPIPL